MSDEEEIFVLKMIIVGDSAVGKTNLLSRYVDNKFLEKSNVTVMAEFYSKDIKKNGKNVKLQFWDTAGQELFKSISNAFYKNA